MKELEKYILYWLFRVRKERKIDDLQNRLQPLQSRLQLVLQRQLQPAEDLKPKIWNVTFKNFGDNAYFNDTI